MPTTEIDKALQELERTTGVEILFAVESGSRAWGFSSPNSDYDIRFVYKRPLTIYLELNNAPETLTHTTEQLDIHGWDIRKAMSLLAKSNTSLHEWLRSPIVYKNLFLPHAGKTYIETLKDLTIELYSKEYVRYSYSSIAKQNYKKPAYFSTETATAKKYFYVVRSLLAARWIETRQELPPIELSTLLTQDFPDREAVTAAVNDLLLRKKTTTELLTIPRVPVLDSFIETQLDWCDSLNAPTKELLEAMTLARTEQNYKRLNRTLLNIFLQRMH